MIKVTESSLNVEFNHFDYPLDDVTGAVPGHAPEQPHRDSVDYQSTPGYGLGPGQFFDGFSGFY